MVEVMLKCRSCDEKTTVGTHNIKRSLMVTEDGEYVWMMYFDCPYCSMRNFVQADNHETSKLVEAESKLVINVMKQKKYGKTPHKKQSEKRKQIAEDLAKTRNKLMESMVGKTAIDCESKERYTVYFTVM